MAMKLESVARNRFKQIIQIEGQPEAIFQDYTAEHYTIVGKLDDKEVRVALGKIGKGKADQLLKLGINIIREEKPSTRHVNIPGVISSKRTKNYTLLEVAAPTEEEKNKRVASIEQYLAGLGIKTRERCEWVCKVDKAMLPPTPARESAAPMEETLTCPPGLKGLGSNATKHPLVNSPELCPGCGHKGHVTWCSHCNNGSRYEKLKPSMRKREMVIEMGIGAPRIGNITGGIKI